MAAGAESRRRGDRAGREHRVAPGAGDDAGTRVQGLTHQAVHVSPDNPRYGLAGDYRDCGVGAPRAAAAKASRLDAPGDELWYGLWNREPPPDARAVARGTFSPRFDALIDEIAAFLEAARDAADG